MMRNVFSAMAIVGVGLVLVLAGCQPADTPSTPDKTTTEPAAKAGGAVANAATDKVVTKDAAKAAAPASSTAKTDAVAKKADKKAAAPKKPARNFAVNGSFEEADDKGAVANWWSKDKIERVEPGSEGKYALALHPAKGKITHVKGAVAKGSALAGQKVQVSAMCKVKGTTAKPAPLVLGLRTVVAGKEKIETDGARADGEWHKLSFEVDVPKDADPKKLDLVFSCRDTASGPALVDDVRVTIAR